MTLNTTPVERPAFALAYLARCGLGEIVVRRAGYLVERRYFQVPAEPSATCDALCPCRDCVEARR